jgi:putative transcriptional regulator
VPVMDVSYKKLWKLLIDKDMKKKDLQAKSGVSWTSITKLSKGETVSMEVLMKVCMALDCNVGDIVEFMPLSCDAKQEDE